MSDRRKGCLSAFLFLCAIVLPAVGLLAGWIGWSFRTGALAGLVVFAACFVLGGIMAALIEKPSLVVLSLPFVTGILYGAFGPVPLPFDDVIVASAGAIVSSALYLRHYADAPKWIVIPLIVAGLYTLVGEFVPGPVDELLVGIIALGTAAAGARRASLGATKVDELPEPDR